ncbi:hypothetical protein C8J57DRAFT_1483391 [Mycena rebaudengoi]|nr:hypothetical protein C8J57DRAFT_1483391 [Mycena rebaudengoi]
MDTLSEAPRLPLDIERVILELAALLRPTTIPKLMLVAWRAKIWLEPLLYRVVMVWPRGDDKTYNVPAIAPQILHRVIANKSPEFFRNAVDHLLIYNCIDWSEGEVDAILTACNRVTNLFIYTPSARPLHALATLRCLQRLTIASVDLSALCASGTALALENVTHIELLDTDDLFMIHSPEDPDLSGLTSCLVLIPCLTHIAFNSPLPINNPFTIALFSKARIQCIACLFLDGLVENQVEPLRPLAQDNRFVCIDQGLRWREDWVRGTQGVRDYWSLAESFIAAKRAGNVHIADSYSIAEGDKWW